MTRDVPVQVKVTVDKTWRVGHTVQVYTDFGTGTIDMSKPLLARPVPLFAGRRKPRGYGRSPYGRVPYGDKPPSLKTGGHGRQAYGRAPYGGGAETLAVTVLVPDGFGVHKFAAEVRDAEGNVQSGAVVETTALVSGRKPPPVRAFAFSAFDQPSDRVTFAT